jgi:hypothetical protein
LIWSDGDGRRGWKKLGGEKMRKCIVCGKEHDYRLLTCSEECHEKLIQKLIEIFGEYKVVVDVRTGAKHLVPTRIILEEGLSYGDLKKYPVIGWVEKDGKAR